MRNPRMDFVPAPGLIPNQMMQPKMQQGMQMPYRNMPFNNQNMKMNAPKKDDPAEIDEAAGLIYEFVDKKYPE
jgi:hypothetical protein